mmetsp:Transcript_30826/g.62146  ORF Transcript_30826/g.62146 Transcript_30826/m.62146 type:complete len:983 (+) Transcript_30826:20-2968(+)
MSDQNNNRQALLTEQLADYCRSDALSEDGLRDKINRLRVVDLPHDRDTTDEELLLHEVCDNERVTEGIIRCILGKITTAAMADDDDGKLPLHYVLWNENVTLKMVQLLIDAAPESIMHQDNDGSMPIHRLCGNYDLEEEEALKTLKFLVDKSPQSARHADKDGDLPIHIACLEPRSPEFCRLLIESYPGSERIVNNSGMLPLHLACQSSTVATAEYFLNIFQAGIAMTSDCGYPIHCAIAGLCDRGNDASTAAKMVELLLARDPDIASQTYAGSTPLEWALLQEYDTNLHIGLRVIHLLYDAYPEAATAFDPLLMHNAISNEIISEEIIRCIVVFVPRAAGGTDDDGQHPLHLACNHNNVTLKIVQLLLDASPVSITHQDYVGLMPIHHLCCNHDLDDAIALEILKFLLDTSPQSARHADKDGDLPIYLACVSSKSPEFCRMLIESYPGSERIKNSRGMLPLHLASQSGTVATVKYLLEIYPDGINDESEDGNPIYLAIMGLRDRKGSEVAAKMVELLLSCNPDLTVATLKSVVWESGYTPLRLACGNSHVTLNIVQRLVDAHPDSVRQEDDEGWMLLHHLCDNDELDDMVSIEILRLLLEKCPGSVRHVNNDGYLPIHIACGRGSRSPDFCRELIEAYPASARIAIASCEGFLPLHYACQSGTSATVKYFVDNYPEQIHVSGDDIGYPIFCAVTGLKCIRNEDVNMQEDPTVAVEKVKILLACDASIVLQEYGGRVPLVYACRRTNDFSFPSSSLNAAIKVIQLLYDAHPESLVDHKTILTGTRDRCDNREISVFLTTQFAYAEQMSDRHFMMTPDENGRLPLHTALLENATLGSIKLLVKGNPNAIQTPDNSGVIPLHVACRHHESTSVIQHLIGLDESTLNAVDRLYNTPLHLACQGGKHETIALLVEENDAVSVSKKNAHKKLPIHLLFESDVDKSSIEYTQSIFLLFKAYPETVNMASAEDEDCLSQTRLKRKFHDV